jgi:hypothetical protein
MLRFVRDLRTKGIRPRNELERVYMRVLEDLERDERVRRRKDELMEILLSGTFTMTCPKCSHTIDA